MKQKIPSRRLTAGEVTLLLSLSLTLFLTSSAFAQRAAAPGGMRMGSPSVGMPAARGVAGRPDRNPGTGRLGAHPSAQPRTGLQLGLGGRWWDDHHTIRKLKISPDQQQRMDAIFEANKPALLDLYNKFQQQESSLSSLSHSDLQDESKVFSAIDRVSQARSDLEKENAHILLQIRKQLDPQQIQALDREIAKSH
ncbi:MAG: periplasmic heavy metal sensor [Acidobacteriaceae bacterium]